MAPTDDFARLVRWPTGSSRHELGVTAGRNRCQLLIGEILHAPDHPDAALLCDVAAKPGK